MVDSLVRHFRLWISSRSSVMFISLGFHGTDLLTSLLLCVKYPKIDIPQIEQEGQHRRVFCCVRRLMNCPHPISN
jgi:hypothetical protein